MHVFAKTPTRHHPFNQEDTGTKGWKSGHAKDHSKPFFADTDFHWPSFEPALKPGLRGVFQTIKAALHGFWTHLSIQPHPNATAFVAPDTSWLGQPGRVHAPEEAIATAPEPGQVRIPA